MQRSAGWTRALGVGVGVAGSLAAAMLAGAGPLSGTGCGTTPAGGGTGNQNPAGAPIVLGASVPLTGSLAGNAPALQGGLLAAVQQVNALGGILGRTVIVDAEDDASEATQALTVARALFGAGAASMIGPTGSAEVSAVEPFTMMNKLVEVSATATSAQLTAGYGPKKGYFFRTVPSDAYQAIAVALFARGGPSPDAGKGGCTRMDIVHNTDTYGDPLASAIQTYFQAHGGAVPSSIGVPANALGSYTSQVQQVLTDLPGCLVLAVYPETAATFMQDLSNALAPTPPTGWSHTFFVVGTDGTYDPSLITDGLEDPSNPSGPSFVQGMYGTVALTNDHTRSEYNELANLYVAEVGLGPGKSDLDPYTSNQYDAVVLELLAMQAAGTTTDGPAIQQAMFDVSRGKVCGATPYGPANLGDALSALRAGGDINYQGASGDVDFDDYGDVIANFLVWQVKGSGFVSHAQISATELALALPKTDAGGAGCQ